MPAGQSPNNAETRVGLHAYDRSYVQYFIGPFGNKVAANISVEYTVGGTDKDELSLLVTPIECGGGSDCSDFEIQLFGRFAWLRAGAASVYIRIGHQSAEDYTTRLTLFRSHSFA